MRSGDPLRVYVVMRSHKELRPVTSRERTTGPSTQSPALSLTSAGTCIEAHMADYDPAPTSDEEIEQAYQEKYG